MQGLKQSKLLSCPGASCSSIRTIPHLATGFTALIPSRGLSSMSRMVDCNAGPEILSPSIVLASAVLPVAGVLGKRGLSVPKRGIQYGLCCYGLALETYTGLGSKLWGKAHLRLLFGHRWKFSLYSQLEVITARMIGNFVPKDAKLVVQLGGSTKELFYYPKNTRQVTVVGEDITPGLFEQAGFQAQMPTIARKQSCSNLGFIPDSSVDAVVCLRSVSNAGEKQRQQQTLSEAVRILKPGAPLIFIESLTDGASPVRGIIGNFSSATPMGASELEDLLDRPTLDVLQVDVALQGTDPHAVGYAKRTTKVVSSPQKDDGLEDALKAVKKSNRKATDKGFRSSTA